MFDAQTTEACSNIAAAFWAFFGLESLPASGSCSCFYQVSGCYCFVFNHVYCFSSFGSEQAICLLHPLFAFAGHGDRNKRLIPQIAIRSAAV